MAFHPYPQLIPHFFNNGGFGPPFRITGTSTWPWVAHSVSGLRHATISPYSDSVSLRLHLIGLTLLRSSNSLTHYAKGTRSPCLGHRAPTACRLAVSGSISLPSTGCFSPFPHGTSSLSVVCTYLALEDGPPRFRQGFTCPAVLGNDLQEETSPSPTGLLPAMAEVSTTFS